MKKILAVCLFILCMITAALAPTALAETAQTPANSPAATPIPAATQPPAATSAPAVTSAPAATQPPAATSAPAATQIPAAAQTPATQPTAAAPTPGSSSSDIQTEPPAESTLPPAVTAPPAAKNLQLSVTSNRAYAFAGRDGITLTINVSGGAAPYAISVSLNGSGYQQITAESPGSYAVHHTPSDFGRAAFRITVTDAKGSQAAAQVAVPVAVHEGEELAEHWEAALQDVTLTGSWQQDLIAIAKTQVGYTESSRNFIIDYQGEQQGYARYGAWYGNAYADWCGMFISFCLHYAGIPESDFPYEANCEFWKDKLMRLGAYEDDEDEYRPQPGDLVFFSYETSPAIDHNIPQHVGIVTGVTEYGLYAIEGNAQMAVCNTTYQYGDPSIVGYANTGLLAELADPSANPGEEEEDEAVQLTGCTKGININIRSQATTGSDIVATVAENETPLTITDRQKSEGWLWYQVECGGHTGYIRSDLVTVLREETDPGADE